MKKISHYLNPRLITFLDIETRTEAIDALIELMDVRGLIPNKGQFRKAIFERENLTSTGIGMGVAIPHAKLKGFSNFLIVVGLQQKGGIEWDAIDQAPVRLILLIAGPDDRQSEYLQILSQVTLAIKDHTLRKNLMRVFSAQEVLDIFSQF